jgi:hypothetical protein
MASSHHPKHPFIQGHSRAGVQSTTTNRRRHSRLRAPVSPHARLSITLTSLRSTFFGPHQLPLPRKSARGIMHTRFLYL